MSLAVEELDSWQDENQILVRGGGGGVGGVQSKASPKQQVLCSEENPMPEDISLKPKKKRRE